MTKRQTKNKSISAVRLNCLKEESPLRKYTLTHLAGHKLCFLSFPMSKL
jgi:hypothetical protein